MRTVMNGDVVVGVVSHRPFRMPEDRAYLPIWVGSQEDMPEGFVSHAYGEGIPELNQTYCELTGLYWLWKNVHAEYKGLVHYRRIFSRRSTRDVGQVLTSDDYRSLLKDACVLLPAKQMYPGTTIYDHYVASKRGYEQIHRDDLAAIAQAVKSVHPSFAPYVGRVLHADRAHLLNIFCMREKQFDEYCAWLFALMSAFMELRMDREDRRRFVGSVSEFMIDVWLAGTGYSYRECRLYEPEQHVVKGAVNSVLRRPRAGLLHEKR